MANYTRGILNILLRAAALLKGETFVTRLSLSLSLSPAARGWEDGDARKQRRTFARYVRAGRGNISRRPSQARKGSAELK